MKYPAEKTLLLILLVMTAVAFFKPSFGTPEPAPCCPVVKPDEPAPLNPKPKPHP